MGISWQHFIKIFLIFSITSNLSCFSIQQFCPNPSDITEFKLKLWPESILQVYHLDLYKQKRFRFLLSLGSFPKTVFLIFSNTSNLVMFEHSVILYKPKWLTWIRLKLWHRRSYFFVFLCSSLPCTMFLYFWASSVNFALNLRV